MQKVVGRHEVDENGMPTGGYTMGTGISITWQNGPLGRGPERREPTGAFVEGVLAAAIDRMEFYQSSKFKCRENALAITKMEEALHWLDARTSRRERVGIEGTHYEGQVTVG